MNLRALVEGPVLDGARGLLGRRVVSTMGGRTTEVVLTEVEAYDGSQDPASHAFGGRTVRNATMFGPAGKLYVYRSYGIHWCMNVVFGAVDTASAVLLRGGIPVEGVAEMERRRGRSDHLTDGPGKLCQALGVTGELDGADIFAGPVTVSEEPVDGMITAGPRVGISKAAERPWRFVLQPEG